MTEQSSLQQKQNYLRTQIIEKGHDPQYFVTYCIDKYGEVDLQVWDYEKLKNIVQQFINTLQSSQIAQKSQNNFTQAQNKQGENQEINSDKPNKNQYNQKLTQQSKNQTEQQDQQWNDFECGAGNMINQNQVINHGRNQGIKKSQHSGKKNLVFSQADWDIFLSGGSSKNNNQIATTNQDKKPISEHSMANYQFQIFGMVPQHKQSARESEMKIPSNNKVVSINQTIQISSNKQTDGSDKKPKSQKKIPKPNNKQLGQNIPVQKYQNKKIEIKVQKTKQVGNLPQISDIQIIQTEQISRNFLKSDYTLYHIQFRPTQHIIKRKFSDFRKLRSILQKLYPTVRLPYIEPEGWLMNTSQGKDPDALTRYKWMIVQFLKYVVLHNKQLKNSPLIRQFIGMTSKRDIYDKDYIKNLFQQYNNTIRVKYINDLSLHFNQFEFEYNPNYPKYIKNHQNILPEIQGLYEKLKRQLQLMFYNYEILTKSMGEVNSTFESLQNSIKKLNFQNDSNKQMRVYDGLKQVGVKLQNSVSQQCVLFKNKIYNLVRYEKQNMHTIKQVLQARNKMNADFIKQGSPPHPILEQEDKIMKFSATLPLDQGIKNNKNYLSMQNSFWDHVAVTQIDHYWKNLRGKICQQLTAISYDQLDTQNDNLNFWNTVIKKCVI